MSDDFFGNETVKGGASPSSFSSSLQEDTSTMKQVDEWMRTKDEVQDIVALIYGGDGTFKTGLALAYPVNPGEKVVILDVDGTALPVVKTFYKERYKKGEIIVKKMIADNPDTLDIDYDKTIKNVLGAIAWTKRNQKKENIKLLVVDGVSTLLKLCEWRMKQILDLGISETVTTRFWQVRARLFNEILLAVTGLNMNVIFIGHEKFIITDEKAAAPVQSLGQMVYQKVLMLREPGIDGVKFTARLDKSKYKPELDGQTYEVLNRVGPKVTWSASKFWADLLG